MCFRGLPGMFTSCSVGETTRSVSTLFRVRRQRRGKHGPRVESELLAASTSVNQLEDAVAARIRGTRLRRKEQVVAQEARWPVPCNLDRETVAEPVPDVAARRLQCPVGWRP